MPPSMMPLRPQHNVKEEAERCWPSQPKLHFPRELSFARSGRHAAEYQSTVGEFIYDEKSLHQLIPVLSLDRYSISYMSLHLVC